MAKKQKCEVYSRVVGYLSPVSEWNKGKKEEFKDRKTFKHKKSSEMTLSVEKQNNIIINYIFRTIIMIVLLFFSLFAGFYI